MDNPFAGLKRMEPAGQTIVQEIRDHVNANEQRRAKRDSIYCTYAPLVSEVLDQFISSYAPGIWLQGSDMTHAYCCRINWYAGPAEPHQANYDEHHQIRRMVEITLEQDEACSPTGFKITHHGAVPKTTHAGLTREELIRGIQDVFQ